MSDRPPDAFEPPADGRGAIAELRRVSKSFRSGGRRVQALAEIDLAVRPGELVLIEGPSGSGKTTLLQILGLLQRPDEGEVHVAGRRLDRLPEAALPEQRRRHVVFIFQGFNLLESLTVRENVAVAARLCGRRGTDEVLARVDLLARADHRPPHISGGEKQRAAIARALACDGELVLADEPTANLDWDNARPVLASLRALADRGDKAVVVVSHDARLEPFADRIVRLMDGRIVNDQRLDPAQAPSPPPPASRTRDDAHHDSPRPRRGVTHIVVASVGALMLLAVLAAIAAIYLNRDSAASPPSAAEERRASAGPRYVAAAPAMVEPASRLITIRTERPGRIKSILKSAGQAVAAGEPLILLDESAAASVVEQRQSDLALAEADLARLTAWQRPEERAKARAALERAQTRFDRAARERRRVEDLRDARSASSSELDQALEEHRFAAAALEEARQEVALADAGPTREELDVAAARVGQARAALRTAQTQLAQCTIASPIDGHVVYRHLEPGEVVDPDAASPILTVGNLDRLRLRAEVDEADIQRVRVGLLVEATADAFGTRVFSGRVVHLEAMMGRKSIQTGRTNELSDTRVREVLVDLDPSAVGVLPVGLQVTARFIERDGAPP